MHPSGDTNVHSLFRKQARQRPTSVALVAPTLVGNIKAVTYGELFELSAKAAGNLAAFQPGNFVLTLLPLSVELYAVIAGLLQRGLVPVLLEPKEVLRQLRTILPILQPSGCIATSKANALCSLLVHYRRIPVKIIVNNVWKPNGVEKIRPVLSASPALINYTSGSEGLPKGVVRSHKFLRMQYQVLQRHLSLGPQHRILTTLPVFAMQMLAAGATVLIPPMRGHLPWLPVARNAIEMVQNYNVNMLMGAPAFLNELVLYALRHNIVLPSVKEVYVGGGFLDRELIGKLNAVLPIAALYVIYGSTEAEPISIMSVEGLNLLPRYGYYGYCVGKPVPEAEVRIVRFKLVGMTSKDIVPLKAGSIGELIVSGRHVNDRYIPQEPAWTLNKVRGTAGRVWHRTGDAAYFDRSHKIWLVGRYKHLPQAVLDNYWPYLRFEAELKRLQFVRRAALVGNHLFIEHTGSWWQRLIGAHKKQVMLACREHGFIPEKVVFCRKLPLDRRHNSKIDYSTLKFFANKKVTVKKQPVFSPQLGSKFS